LKSYLHCYGTGLGIAKTTKMDKNNLILDSELISQITTNLKI